MRRGDRFDALQDDLVQHVLSFLPSHDAVKSAALSRRWRHLWMSTPAVRVGGNDHRFRLFVNSLFLHRDSASPLRSFEIDADLTIAGKIDPHVEQWIRHALSSSCRTRSLTARFPDEDTMWSPRNPRIFASPHLTTMHLHYVKLAGEALLDFSCCPALLHLSLNDCRLVASALVSPSLERLSIIGCDIRIPRNADGRTRMGISTSSLRYLHLCDDVAQGFPKAPCLQGMPCLTNATVRLTGYLACNPAKFYDGGDHSRAGRSLLLHGLSEATSLVLMASPSSDARAILLGDLKWCPTFTKLKTLTLNEWCVYVGESSFVCLLRHTPRLESLILQLPFENRPTLEVKTEGSHITSEHTFPTLDHLKTVEIKNCHPSYYSSTRMVDFSKRVDQITKLFSDWGIPGSKISINTDNLKSSMPWFAEKMKKAKC